MIIPFILRDFQEILFVNVSVNMQEHHFLSQTQFFLVIMFQKKSITHYLTETVGWRWQLGKWSQLCCTLFLSHVVRFFVVGYICVGLERRRRKEVAMGFERIEEQRGSWTHTRRVDPIERKIQSSASRSNIKWILQRVFSSSFIS
jgi:hypothetical protein